MLFYKLLNITLKCLKIIFENYLIQTNEYFNYYCIFKQRRIFNQYLSLNNSDCFKIYFLSLLFAFELRLCNLNVNHLLPLLQICQILGAQRIFYLKKTVI